MRQDQVAMLNAARRGATFPSVASQHKMGSIHPTQTVPDEGKVKPQVVPNRTMRRRSRKSKKNWTSNPYGRVTGLKSPQPQASLFTLVAIHVRDEAGKTIRKFVVPRENVDQAMLAKPRSEVEANLKPRVQRRRNV